MAEPRGEDGAADPLGQRLRGRLGTWVERQQPGFWADAISVELIGEGRSNLTALVTDGHREAILRCPPPGEHSDSAHNVAREFRFLRALEPGPTPVPRPLLLCEDASVIGRPFYLMERVPGRIFARPTDTERLSPAEASAITGTLVDTLAGLHSLDPATVGLADVGNPAGFTQRHLDGWTTRLARWQGRPLPNLERLAQRLRGAVPEHGRSAIVHGDYRLGNLVIAPDRPAVAAVLDWEMATVGDPLTDVGWLAMSWIEEEGPDGIREDLGFPPLAEVLARYRSRSGIDAEDCSWYIAFACFKLAVLREGIRRRHERGETEGTGFESIGDRVESVARCGLDVLDAPS